MDTQVTEYIEKQQSPQKEILQRIRNMFQNTLSNSREKMAWGVPTYAGGKFYIAAMKTRVHVGFAITGLSEEEIARFDGTGKTMRHVKISTEQDIVKKGLAELIELVDRKAICKPC